MLKKLTALTLCALLALAGVPARAAKKSETKPSKGAELAGVIRDEGGKPLPGVRVVLTALEGAAASFSTTTDGGGAYELTHLPSGLFEISFAFDGKAYVGNRVLLIAPEQKQKANFRLGGFTPQDSIAGLTPGQKVPGLEGTAAGVGRLEERTGPTGLAWFRTGKGVAVLVAGAAALVGGLITFAEKGSDKTAPISPTSP